MFPADNAKIGICPSEDFWTSFNRLDSDKLSDVPTFNEHLKLINNYFSQSDPEKLKNQLLEIDAGYLNSFIDAPHLKQINFYSRTDYVVKIIKKMEEHNFKNLLELMEYLFEPVGFKTSLEDTTDTDICEVFVQGECLFILDETSIQQEILGLIKK